MGRKLIYTAKTFRKVKPTKWEFIDGNPRSIQQAAYKWAKERNIEVITHPEPTGLWIKEKCK